MLILTRRPQEKIFITTKDGEEIIVSLLTMNGKQAKLGIEAPREITVHREEIHDLIQKQKANEAHVTE